MKQRRTPRTSPESGREEVLRSGREGKGAERAKTKLQLVRPARKETKKRAVPGRKLKKRRRKKMARVRQTVGERVRARMQRKWH